VHIFQPSTFYDILCEQKPDVIIVHYVGYAYNRYALPFYLISALRQFKQRFKCRLLVFFHEIYSWSTSLLKLPFYTEWIQRYIVRRLVTIADKSFTNCAPYRALLNEIMGEDQRQHMIECTGIFSNIPDDLFNASVSKDEKTLVVFGSLHNRQSVYRNKSFPYVLQRLDIDTIYDIGPGDIDLEDCVVRVIKKGALPSDAVAWHFNKAKYGALSYKPELLGKSGIFSAYAAFGIIAINLVDEDRPLHDDLEEGSNYFNVKSISKADRGPCEADKIREWYGTRNQRMIAAKIRMHL
jgi:hypothetical protein